MNGGPGPTLVFDTASDAVAGSPSNRFEAFRDFTAQHVGPVVTPLWGLDAGFAFKAALRPVGDVAVGQTRCRSATPVHACKHHDIGPEPSLLLGVQLAGSTRIQQHGRQAVSRVGDIVAYDTRRPWEFQIDNSHRCVVRIPLQELALPDQVVNQLTAIRLSPDKPLVPFAASYFTELARAAPALTAPAVRDLARATIAVTHALLSAQLDDPRLASASLQATLPLRVRRYIDAHLGDPTLSAARVAEAHHVSLRQLQRVMSVDGVSVGSYIRRRRLEGCRADLDQGRLRHLTVAAVARRCGFSDASSFGRAFKAAYGLPPQDWRSARSHGENGAHQA